MPRPDEKWMTVSEKKPNDAVWDSAHDSDEPAFEWMKGSTAADASADAEEKPQSPLPEGSEAPKAPSVDELKEPAAWDPEVTAAMAAAKASGGSEAGKGKGPDESPAAPVDMDSSRPGAGDAKSSVTGESLEPDRTSAGGETADTGAEGTGAVSTETGVTGTPASSADTVGSETETPGAFSTDASSIDAGTSVTGESAEDTPAVLPVPVTGGPATVIQEKLPTSALTVRAPDEEVQKRQAARDAALAAKPVGPRVVKVLSAIFLPLLLVITAVRVVATPLFLWIEYFRPGFPGDGYGFSQEDRLTYGSYAVDYLSNFAGPRYLGDLVTASGTKLFRDPEISHMADVKMVTMTTWGVGALLAVLALIAVWYLGRRRDGSLRHAFFSASVVTLVIILALGVVGFLGWDSFFTGFHEIFFANGTWTFSLQDTLIRLFPGQFWIDSAATIAALVFLTALVTLICTWPTKRRREARKAVIAGRLAAQQAAVAGE